jgi:CRISPR-associated protein Cas2
MLIVAYDFSNDKRRAKFAKFLEQYGSRVQYSVFRVKNSKRVLNNIIVEIEKRYRKHFKDSDSIVIFSTCEGCDRKIMRFGYASHEEEDVVYIN